MNRKSQVWVETVIYTLVMLVMIGAALAFIKPKIEEMQDKTIIEQTLEVMRGVDNKVIETTDGATGNQRTFELIIKKGSFKIDAVNDKIIFEITESKYVYSEPGQNVQIGNIIARTDKTGKTSTVTLTIDYSQKYDLKYNGESVLKSVDKSSTPYQFSLRNNGVSETNNRKEINFQMTN